MKEVTLPDEKVIKIPDNLDPVKMSELAAAVSRQYDGFNIYEPTLGGRIAEFGKALPRGGLSTLASAIKGPVALFDVGDDSLSYQAIKKFEEYLQEDSALAPEAGYEDLYSTKLGGAFGSFAPFLGAGMIGGALSRAGVLSTRAGMYGVPAGLAIPAGMGQQADIIEMSREAGKEVGGVQETLATLLGGAIGLTEIYPVARILKKVPRKTLEDLPTKQLILEYMKSAADSGTREGLQEVAASFLQNMVARGLYNEDLPLVDSVFDEFTLGGIVGGTVDLVFNSMQKRRGIATHEEGERAERAKVDSNKLIEAKKAELAEQQGVLPVIQDQPFKIAPSIPAPVEPEIAPDLQIIENTDSTFSLLDQNNLENPVVKTVPTQAEALAESKKVKDAFARKQIKQQLENDLYSLGLINSSTAYRIGESLLNPNSVSVGINTIIKYDPKAKNKTLKQYREELEAAGTYNKLPFQNQYTIADAQKLLSKKQFNQFASDAAAKIFENSEKNGMPSIRDDKGNINTSRKYIKDFAAGKNIELDFNTSAVNYAAKRYTGEGNYSKMSKGQKELFLAKLHSLPSFSAKTPFPNFTPRPYSAKDTADFVATIGSTEFVGKDVQNFLSDRGISTLAATDFIRDLDQSGRAEFVKGKEKGFLTSVRQIRPNFEFDIARRAEGFNETPEEFGARLRSQGELKEEVIEQMVQNETARQEPYIPPEQLEEQTINFAEAMEEGRTSKFAKELRKILNVRGLKDTGVIVSNEILSTSVLKERDGQIVFDPRKTRETTEEGAVEGEYDKNTDIIFLSLNAVNPDGNATDAEIQTRLNKILDHEMIHALRAKDLITESEYRYLKNLVKNKRVPQAVDAQAFKQKETFYTRSRRINKGIENYGASENKVEEIYIEEAIAELFRAREVVAKDVPPKAKGIYNKIVQFFQGVGNAMKISGYNKAADIFQDIEAGRVGARTRGEIRTLRDLDQAGKIQAQVVTDYEEDRETPTGPVIETKVKPTSPRPLAFEPRTTPPTIPPVIPPTTPPVVTPPATPEAPETDIPRETTPDSESTPNTIYDSSTRSREDKEAERRFILDGLAKAGVIKGKANYKGIVRGETIPMVKWLKDNAPSKDYEIIASKALEKLNRLKNKGLTFPFQIGGLRTTQGYVRYAPFGTQFAMRINDNDLGSTGVDFETMLHEIAHSTTQYQINLIQNNNLSASRRGKKPEGVSAKEFAAFKELDVQRERVLKAVNIRKEKFNKIFNEVRKQMKGSDPFDIFRAYKIAINKSNLGYIWTEYGEAIGEKRIGETSRLNTWNNQYIKYIIEGRQNPREKSNSSEFISWGLTNRNFQEFLENIPLTNNKTAWSKFVETIRKILNLPARLDTELSAFLHNAADVIGGTEVVTAEPRAPPETKKGEIPFATRPTKVIVTKAFTYTKNPEEESRAVLHNGELNGFKLQLGTFDGSWWVESPLEGIIKDQQEWVEQTVNGVTLKVVEIDPKTGQPIRYESNVSDWRKSLKDINLLARNKKEAVAEVKKLWEELLRTGSYIYGDRSENKLILDEGVTLNEARQDVPTFSRISKRGELDNRIADLDRRIYDKENVLRVDTPYISTATYNRLSNEIFVLETQKDRLVEERDNLPPEDVPLFSRGPRDESSGHVADSVPAQYGPPAHDLTIIPEEEFSPEGYSIFGTTVDYDRLQKFSTQRGNLATINRIIDSAPTEREGLKIIKDNPDYLDMLTALSEEQQFLNKLKEIKGNPNATITMYQAAPQRDLREGDLITPFLSEAQYLVDESKITQKDIRDAELQQLRQDLGLDKDTIPNLNLIKYYNERKKMYSQIDGIFDAPQATPSTIHTYELKAGDVRWDGNNGWARWGYFPRIKAVEDIPLFSRASTDTSPAYMDFSREQIALESTMDVHFYPNYPTEVPLTWVARINIDDFLYMTTSNDAEIQEIAEEGLFVKGKRVQPKFDPEIFDEGTIGLLPRLSIDQNGKVTSHEGRHRIALAKKEGAITTPVFFKMHRNDMGNLLRGEFFKDKNLSNAALQDLGIYNLKSQFRESAVQRGVLDISGMNKSDWLITAPVVRGDTQTMETLRQKQLDFATQVAQGPDVKARTNNPPINLPQDIPLFSRANISKRFEPYDGDIPTFSRAQLKSKPILFKDKIIMEEGDVSNISEFARRSRTYDKKLKTIPLDLVNKYPKLRELSLKNLRKLLNKNGNLVVYRSLNLSENEEIINNGQLPNDPFASTTLDSKYAQTLGKDIAVQNIFQIKLVNKLYKDKKISESDYKILTRQSLDMFDNMDKEVVINKLRNQGIELVKKFERPINVLRYEIPLDRVILHMPIVPEAIRNDFTEVADYENSQGGGDIRPEYDDYVQDGMTEEQIEDAEVEYEDDLSSYESEINALTEQIEDGFLNMEEESEVIANLDGITPTYIYKPSSSELEFQDSSRKGKRYAKDIPLFSRASRNFSDGNSNESIKRREAVKVAEERTKETPRGQIPFYNMNASDIALEAAIEFNQDLLKIAPDDIPTFSRTMPSNLQEAADTVGVATPKESLATRLIDFVSNPITNIKKRFKTFRQSYIDKFDPLDKRIVLGSEENEEVRRANNTADTASIAGIRMAERAKGVFQQMLLKGIPVDVIEGMPSLAKVIAFEINTKYNPLIEGDTSIGGLMQILSATQSDPEIDLEGVFALYGKLKRVKKINAQGIEIASPITPKELQAIETIEREHPVVVEAYNNYQKWNNALVDFATKKGLLDADQAAKWIEHSSYYPFYRVMVDEGNITAPTIAGGSLANNPLNMPMKGSEEKIDVDPIEAILRNSLSILTAAMKNDGMMKLIRDFELLNNPEKGIKEATLITDKKKLAGINSVFVFENGNKKHYKIADIDLFMAMQSMGGIKSEGLMKALAIPAGLLRDTVTRDPGFVFVNVLRDTLSAAVTSGAPLGGEGFTPILDSFKQLFGDISSLEEFGVIGGYDFANDEGDVKTFLNRARRRAGLSPNNGMRADVAFYKLWDGLGYLTTKSDGATRKAVANAVYKKLIKEGYTEAQAQSEASYQALEIINFGRRGSSPIFRILTTAIPFLNARVQGLDVLYRSFTGKYSAQDKLQEGGSLEDLQGMIMRRSLSRMAVLIGTTALYYALISDTDEYKAEKLEKRDDNWIIPIGGGNVFYIPIPFEVGMLGKAIPERFFDLISGEDAFSDTSITDFKESVVRQFSKSAEIPFLGGDISIQLIKPIVEAMTNRTAFTNSEIVPYFMEKEKPAYQSRKSTNELFRLIGETLNISPIKLEHIFKGYTGTLGGYALTITDALARSVTGTPLMPPNIKQVPLFGRFFGDKERMGGLQQQFYKLREEVNTAVTTINSLREDGRMDELYAYRNQVQGLLNAKGQVRAIERYMRNWRKRRDRLLNRTDINVNVRSDMLLDLQIERDKRLAMIPELRQKANIPPDTVGVILR